MTLFTKSIQEKKSKKDGIRICIMRRPGKFKNFDIWMPVLAPSNQLLNDIHKGKINFKEYSKRYKKEVIKKQKKILKLLACIALKEDITLLCWEKSFKNCHRRLVAEECLRLEPELKITLK